jgi:hypothetical protein
VRKQVITITVEGTMQGLQVKSGQGLDLRQFGDAKIVRASEIVFDDDKQAWKVDVLQEAGRGVVTFQRFKEALGVKYNNETVIHINAASGSSYVALGFNTDKRPGGLLANEWTIDEYGDGDGVLYFEDYNAAVGVEIAYLDGLRKQGVY